jgi:hypothetical protein
MNINASPTALVVIIAVLLVVMFIASFSAAKDLCDISFAVIVNNLVAFASGICLIAGFFVFTVVGIGQVFG